MLGSSRVIALHGLDGESVQIVVVVIGLGGQRVVIAFPPAGLPAAPLCAIVIVIVDGWSPVPKRGVTAGLFLCDESESAGQGTFVLRLHVSGHGHTRSEHNGECECERECMFVCVCVGLYQPID